MFLIQIMNLFFIYLMVMFIMIILRSQAPFCLENQTHSPFLQVKNQWSVPVLCPANIKISALKSVISTFFKHKVGLSEQTTHF